MDLARSSTTFVSYHTFNILSPMTLFLSQYESHAKPFLHLINCLCNISSMLFQVVLGPCKFGLLILANIPKQPMHGRNS